jgi:hypothetical protein
MPSAYSAEGEPAYHPGDFPFQVVAALHAEYAAKLELHDFIFPRYP